MRISFKYLLSSLIFLFSFSLVSASWVQEDEGISGRTDLGNKIEILKDITISDVISFDKIDQNKTELLSLFKSGDLTKFHKADFLEAFGNNLVYEEINNTPKQTYFGYKVIDGVNVLSLKRDFLLEAQKEVDGSYKDLARTDIEALEIVYKTQEYLQAFITGLENFDTSPLSSIQYEYSIISISSNSTLSLNRVFDNVCKKYEEKTICFETQDGGLVAFGLRDQINENYTNKQEYEELLNKYEVVGKIQLPNTLKTKLEASCPASQDIERYVTNSKLDECGLVSQDLDCDGEVEWFDYDSTTKTTTMYSVTGFDDIVSIKVILYLQNKEIVKLYTDKTGCYSNLLTRDTSQLDGYKIIHQGFSGGTGDISDFTLSDLTENSTTLTDGQLSTKSKSLDGPYKFYSTPELFLDEAKEKYRIDVDVTDNSTGTASVLGNINFSSSSNISDRTFTWDINQEKIGLSTSSGEVNLKSSNNGITNRVSSHYTLINEDSTIHVYNNGKELFKFDPSSGYTTLENGSVIGDETTPENLTSDIFEGQSYLIFSDHYIKDDASTTPDSIYSKDYKDFNLSIEDSSKLYFYKLNRENSTVNYYLGQVIDTTGYIYNLFGSGTSGDGKCKSVVFDGQRFFDNNEPLGATDTSYIGHNTKNGCEFRSQKITYSTDAGGSLSYLKKTKITGIYNSFLEIFEFEQSEESSLQGVSLGTALDSSLENCSINQIVNNELDSCSEMMPLDIDGDKWDEWVYSKDGEFEIYNNSITTNSLGELQPDITLILKSNGDSYCTTLPQGIDYYKVRSEDTDNICKDESLVDEDLLDSGVGTKDDCSVDSVIILNSIGDYQLVYGIVGDSKESKKYTRSQIISGDTISCD